LVACSLASAGGDARPGDLEAVGDDGLLKLLEERRVRPHTTWGYALLVAEGRHRASRLADVPLHGVQPVAAVRDVGGADVLRAGEQVLDPLRQQRAEGN